MKAINASTSKKNRAALHFSAEEKVLLNSEDDVYMDDAQLEFFRRRLLAMRANFLNTEQETNDHLKERDRISDVLDRATVEETITLELRLRDRERHLLVKIDQALHRIERRTYGWCEETGEPIGIARLLSRPTATLCLEAQQRRERMQQVYGH